MTDEERIIGEVASALAKHDEDELNNIWRSRARVAIAAYRTALTKTWGDY